MRKFLGVLIVRWAPENLDKKCMQTYTEKYSLAINNFSTKAQQNNYMTYTLASFERIERFLKRELIISVS